ncbi:MAG TPA: AMP-binding protein [Terriglobales bacterium]
MPHLSLIEYLADFERHGSECAFINRRDYRNVRWTYAQVLNLARRFAGELEQRAIRKGDRVLLWGENCAEWVAAFWGCVLRGVVVVPMDDVASPDFAGRVAQQVEAKLLVVSKKHSLPDSNFPTIGMEELQAQRPNHANEFKAGPDLGREDTLEIVFTSGTTAEPKGVVITHGNVLANLEPLEQEIRNYLKYERLVHPVRFLNLLPLSHVFGQFLAIFLPQLMAATVIFQDSLNPSEIMRTVHRERISVVVAVPRVLQSLKEKIERDLAEQGKLDEFRNTMQRSEGQHFLRRWWTFRGIHRQFGWKFWAFICGGAALDRATEEFWGRLGYAVVQGYGLTETTSLISVNHPFKLGKGSVGKVLAGREVKLDSNGEIMVRGGGVATAYWSGKQMQSVAEGEGWYRTGDIGELDEQGNLYFKGRKKDVIVTSAGMNIYPEDLEASLRKQPEVRDCVVIGLEQGGSAEPCAVLILRDTSDPAAVVARANENLADYQRMRAWYVWPDHDFPRTSTQKPRIAVIQKLVQDRLSSGSAGAATSPLAQMIARITGRTAGELRANADLEADLNLSSLDRVELMSALEDRYQIDLGETSFASARTVGDLEKMMRGEAPARVHYHYPRWVLRWPVTWIRLAAHYLLLRPAVFLLGWPRVYGREHLRGVHGPVLVICNHIGDVDVGFVLTALPARLRNRLATATGGEAMESLRTPPASRGWFGRVYDRLKWILGAALLNLFPLPREAGFRQSFEYAGEAVDRGYNILIFPEGRHTTTGELLPFRAGSGILVNSLKIPVVPMRIDGLYEVKQAGKKFALPGKITVRIGEPIRFDFRPDPGSIAEELRARVENL